MIPERDRFLLSRFLRHHLSHAIETLHKFRAVPKRDRDAYVLSMIDYWERHCQAIAYLESTLADKHPVHIFKD